MIVASGLYIPDETSNAVITSPIKPSGSSPAPTTGAIPIAIDAAPIWNVSANPKVSSVLPVPQPASAPPTVADTPSTITAVASGPGVMSGLGNMFGADFPASLLSIFDPQQALSTSGAPAPTTQPAGSGSFNMWLVIAVAGVAIWYLVKH